MIGAPPARVLAPDPGSADRRIANKINAASIYQALNGRRPEIAAAVRKPVPSQDPAPSGPIQDSASRQHPVADRLARAKIDGEIGVEKSPLPGNPAPPTCRCRNPRRTIARNRPATPAKPSTHRPIDPIPESRPGPGTPNRPRRAARSDTTRSRNGLEEKIRRLRRAICSGPGESVTGSMSASGGQNRWPAA